MGATDHWCSPPEVADPLEQLFDGPVGTDPATNKHSLIWARRHYTIGGLHLPWGDGSKLYDDGFNNPPYSSTGPWITKGLHELDSERINELVYLVMSVPSVGWWVEACNYAPRNPRILITERLCFIDPKEKLKKKLGHKVKKMNARFDTALIYYGSRTREFEKEFASITRWSTWGRSGRL